MKPVAPRLPSIPVLVALTAVMPLGMHMLLPGLSAIARDFAVSVPTVQWSVTLFMVAVALAQLVYGPVSDRFGRRRPLLVGLVIFLLGSLACAAATSSPLLLAGRVIQGIGACSGMVLGRAMVRDVYPANRAAVTLGYVSTALVIFSALAPMLGGVLLTWFSWRAPFLFSAAGCVVLLAIAWRLEETHRNRAAMSSVSSLVRDFATLLRLPGFMVPALATALSGIGFFGFIANAPVLAEEIFAIRPDRYGFYFVLLPLGFCTGSFLSTRLTPRLGLHRIALWTSIASAVVGFGLLALTLLSLLTPVLLFALVGLTNLTSSIGMPAMMVRSMGADSRMIGAASGLIGFLHMAFGAVGTQLVAHAYDGTALPAALLIAAGFGTGAVLLIAERLKRPI